MTMDMGMTQRQEIEQTTVGKVILEQNDTPERRAIVDAHEEDQIQLRDFIRAQRAEELSFWDEHITRLMDNINGQFERIHKEIAVSTAKMTEVQITVADHVQRLIYKFESDISDVRREVDNRISPLENDIKLIKERLGIDG